MIRAQVSDVFLYKAFKYLKETEITVVLRSFPNVSLD